MRYRSTLPILILAMFCSTGCAPRRAALPVGEIPRWQSTSHDDQQYGQQVLRQLSRVFPHSRDPFVLSRVRGVVARLAQASGSAPNGWKVSVFADNRVKNAAATRGNYLFLWTGMLGAVQSDDELAAVIAHEMAHVLAQHVMPNPAEELSSAIASAGGAAASGILTSSGSVAVGAAQLGGALIEEGIRGLVINPESRRKEYEADQIGLFLMADAGYDPDAAVNFWERAARDPAFNGGSLEFLSTHPSSQNRSEYLRSLLPAARRRAGRDSPLTNREPYGARQEGSFLLQPHSFHRSSGRYNQRTTIQEKSRNNRAVIVALSARIFAEDDTWSPVRDVVQRGDTVTIVCDVGPFYRIIAPTPGFIDRRAIDNATPTRPCRR